MDIFPRKCANSNTVASFCECIAEGGAVDPAAKAFCERAKTDTRVTGDDLTELKMALMDLEEEECCDCC
jgi:hypothetical protein